MNNIPSVKPGLEAEKYILDDRINSMDRGDMINQVRNAMAKYAQKHGKPKTIFFYAKAAAHITPELVDQLKHEGLTVALTEDDEMKEWHFYLSTQEVPI